MRVAFVTTWGQACGIASYSQQVLEALKDSGLDSVSVLSPMLDDGGVGITLDDTPRGREIPYRPCWSRTGANADALTRTATSSGIDILHFQHEDGLFMISSDFIRSLVELKKAGVKTVVTMHTVRDTGDAEHTAFYVGLRSHASAIVCHTAQAQASLLAAPGPAPVFRIPHGTPLAGEGDAGVGLKALSMPAKLYQKFPAWAIVLGFIGPSKNIVHTIRAYALAITRGVSELGLIVCGAPGRGVEHHAEVEIPGLINACGIMDRVFYRPSFIKDSMVSSVLALADFGILNTRSEVYSASGQVHLFAAHGLPLAVANRPIYIEAVQAGAVPFFVDSHWVDKPMLSTVNAIVSLARSKRLRAQVKAGMQSMAKRTAWPLIAGKHKKVYERVMG